MSKPDGHYRRGVGVMLINEHGHVFVGRRIDNRDEAWQMPQGGIDAGEESWPAALRELQEETGIAPHLVERIACHPQQLRYDIPAAIASRLWGGKWKGQLQDWYLARFLGQDRDIDLATEHPEFSHWQWVEPHLLPELIVPFKRDMYRAILKGFAEHL
ncbi:RNA pyrophosphohydrolase [Sphingomonas xanthus]|uniref:RNA pyrophosphohydrolase n=1 Tax=Sphingomonas xanthus TaxID=2594473 RepID=A0A516ISZ7_9SPHN|nr:RNA pyrophosphohydrolase [Sphingomonas xanthus]QDP20031.1 RNA pyrophosphohydrolase [Sphingomonas xanthus]